MENQEQVGLSQPPSDNGQEKVERLPNLGGFFKQVQRGKEFLEEFISPGESFEDLLCRTRVNKEDRPRLLRLLEEYDFFNNTGRVDVTRAVHRDLALRISEKGESRFEATQIATGMLQLQASANKK